MKLVQNHSTAELKWIKVNLEKIGINEYRFCAENENYICDKYGNFYSVCYMRTKHNKTLYKDYRIVKLEGSIDRDGYRTYRITENGKRKHLKGHRMMMNAWTFKNPKMSVNHKDGNKLNNCLSNLEWVTVRENNIHALKNNLKSNKRKNVYGGYSVIPADWITIYVLNKHFNHSKTKLSKMNRCSRQTIQEIVRKIENVMNKVGLA